MSAQMEHSPSLFINHLSSLPHWLHKSDADIIAMANLPMVIQLQVTNINNKHRLPAGHGIEWNGRRFFHIPYWQFSSIPFPFHTKNLSFHIPFHTKIFFHIPFHTSIPRKV